MRLLKLRDKSCKGIKVVFAIIAASAALASSFMLTGCSKDVVDQEMVITYQDKTIAGHFTGTLEGGNATHGKFVSSDEKNALTFDGDWGADNTIDTGKLDYNGYVVNFKEVDREGHYTGDVADGIACGNGKFSAKNDDGEKYTYTGEWANGLYNGQGVDKWDEGQTNTGTFKDGEFTPTIAEAFVSMGDTEDDGYTVSKKAESFLVAHPDLFNNYKGKIPSKLVRNEISYKKMSKSIEKYGTKLIKVPGLRVQQIWENGETWGFKNDTYVNLMDSSYNVYSVRLFSKTKNIYEGSYVTLTALPLDYATYENVSGGSTWAIMCAGVKVE